MPKSGRTYAVGVLLLLSFVLRGWGVGYFPSHMGDESIHVPTAANYGERGQFTSPNWYHPPVGALFLYGSMKAFGDNPYGWRLRNVVLGSLSVAVLFLLCLELWGDRRVAWVAALLLALDPLHILFSRNSFEEIQTVFLFLVSVWATVRYARGALWWGLVAGVFLGLSIGTKWYYVPGGAVLLGYGLYAGFRRGGWSWSRAVHGVAVLGVLPVAVYVGSFFPWFRGGYDLGDLVFIHQGAFIQSQEMTLNSFRGFLMEGYVPPVLWFVKPMMRGIRVEHMEGWSRFVIVLNNPPLWIWILPALGYGIVRAARTRDLDSWLVALLFLVTYAQFLVARRPIVVYSALSVLPFAYLGLALAGVVLFGRPGLARRTGMATLGVMILWNLYLYPLATHMSVPVFLYRPLLSLGKIFGL